MVQGFILTLAYSRLCRAIPVFKQDLPTLIECFERALAFVGGCPRSIGIDGMKACLDQADLYTPRFNPTFLMLRACDSLSWREVNGVDGHPQRSASPRSICSYVFSSLWASALRVWTHRFLFRRTGVFHLCDGTQNQMRWNELLLHVIQPPQLAGGTARFCSCLHAWSADRPRAET